MLLVRRARHAVRPVRRRTAAAASVIVLAAFGVALPPSGGALAADACRQPVVRDVMISQGLPSYGLLARGKTALFKFFLSEPSGTNCSNVSSESISITGGSLTVTKGATAIAVPLALTPGGALPEFGGYDVAPVTATPADPVFVVEGRHLDSADPAHAASTFSVGFTAKLDYVVKNKSGVVLTSTLTVTQRPGGSAISSVVSKPVKPLRVLVVPMGNPDVTTPAQFPKAATDEVTSGMTAVARHLPLPEGIGALGSTAGLQWHLSSGMLDLGPHSEVDPLTGGTKTVNYMPDGKFCGGGASFDYIQEQLTQYRLTWNAENPTAPADRVLGAVWRDVSRGAQTGDGAGCAEGYARMGGTVGWTRVLPSTTDRKGVTGSLSTLELTHGFGGSVMSVTQTSSGPKAGAFFPHSPSGVADASARNRAYNVPERAFLDAQKNRSVMTYDLAPYDDYNTLLENKDWDFLLCFFTITSPTPSQACGSPISVDSGVSAAGSSYALAGTTDDTAVGTSAHTYLDDDMPRGGEDPASVYRLVQRDAAGATTGPSTGVRVTQAASDHPDGGDHAHEGQRKSFDVAIPQRAGAVSFELWKGEPGSSGALMLYRRSSGSAPVFADTGTTPAPADEVAWTTDGTSSQPAVSPDGSLLALTTTEGGTGTSRVAVARSGDGSPRSNAVEGEQAAWRADGRELAVVRRGEVFLVTVDSSGTGAPTLIGERKVYGNRLGGPAPAASRPTYATDGSELALSISGDLFAVNLGLPTETYPILCPLDALVQDRTSRTSGLACRRLTSSTDALETAPAWSRTSSTLAYTRTATTGSAGSSIWTLDPLAPSSENIQRLAQSGASYDLPAWQGSRLLVSRNNKIVSVSASSFDEPLALTSGPGSWPAAADFLSATTDASRDDTPVFFHRGDDTTSDLFTLRQRQQAATATVEDDDPAQLRMDLVVVCGTHTDPVLVAQRPVLVEERDEEPDRAHFDLRYDTSRVCPNGRLLYRGSDGYSVTRENGEQLAGQGEAAAAIYVPRDGSQLLQFQNLAISGAAVSAGGAATSSIEWTLTDPSGGTVSLGAGGSRPDVVPPLQGWAPGEYILTAIPDGAQARAKEHTFTVVLDSDADGIPDVTDRKAVHDCYPTDAMTNAENAVADYDGDLLASLVDPEPCTSAMNATVTFKPETLNLASNGNPLTLSLSTQALDVASLGLSDVLISQVGGHDSAIPAYALSVKAPGLVEAKFDRQRFIDFFNSRGLRGYVPVVMSATRGGVTARGFDPKAPVYQP